MNSQHEVLPQPTKRLNDSCDENFPRKFFIIAKISITSYFILRNKVQSINYPNDSYKYKKTTSQYS